MLFKIPQKFAMDYFMPKLINKKKRLWIMNMEHALDNYLDASRVLEKGFMRYTMLVEQGDLFVTLPNTNRDFLEYVSCIKKLGKVEDWAIQLNELSNPCDIVDSIMRDSLVVSILKKIAQNDDYFIEPYIASSKLKVLSDFLGIPLAGHVCSAFKDENYIKLNDKKFFKDLSKKLDIDTTKYFFASNKEELTLLIKKISSEYSKLIIKKTFSAGGFGNLIGSPFELISLLETWGEKEGCFLVEPFLNMQDVLGSLLFVSKNNYEFMFLDKQIFKDHIWSGCSYPYANKDICNEIEKYNAIYAKYMLDQGLEGYINIDWGLIREDGVNKIYALEANYRYNGFLFVLDVAKNVFGLDYQKVNVFYDNYYKVRSNIKKMNHLLVLLEKINSIFSVSNKGGVISTNIPVRGEVGLMMVAETKTGMKNLMDLSKSVLLD
jgi:hypothetical protein